MKLMEVLKLLVVITMVMRAMEALWIEMSISGVKCVHEDLRNYVVVLAKYAVIISDNEHTQPNFLSDNTLTVLSPSGKSLHHEENVTHGQFAFTTTEAGRYGACFLMNSHAPDIKGVHIGIDWKTGITAKDWDSVARKEKIEDFEPMLMKLEASVQTIHEKLIYLKKREEEMREVSERTNAAVELFSIMSLSICILVASFQIWYLKRFFRKKKLI
ncbi:Transmembrane emp24 domain-containing protein p24delta5 [Capsicum annuum]|uniref:Transmembrane emp24 domain-containing protein p24delta5 n=1 Tax=Capsicum annuum TaxID=4072 RepID=A0A2G2ZAF2_CAPAN|nr:Transmembrane emp24 domain-containing protein p24delta5 [Capsicum annuum]